MEVDGRDVRLSPLPLVPLLCFGAKKVEVAMATCLAFALFSAPVMGPKLERRGKPFPHLQPATLSRNLGK